MRRARRKVRHVLEKQVTIGHILKVLSIFLLVILCFGIIFGIPYQLGKASVDCSVPQATSSGAKVTTKTAEPVKVEEDLAKKEELVDQKVEEDAPIETSSNTNSGEVDYDDVTITYESINFDKRGDDWGTIKEIKITIDNKASSVIDLETLRMQVYNVGDSKPEWEEFDIILAPIQKGMVITTSIPVHSSVSDLDKDKNIILEIRDEDNKIIKELTEKVDLLS